MATTTLNFTLDPKRVTLVYIDSNHDEYRQSLADVVQVGTYIDENTGEDMEIAAVEVSVDIQYND